jgi:MFS family permease
MHTNKLKTQQANPWVIMSLCAAFMIYKYILQVSPSMMTDVLMQAFQIKGADLGHLAAAFFYSLLIVQLFVGYCLDRYDPRYFTVGALILCALGVIGFVYAKTGGWAILMRAVMGAGAAFATVNYFKMASLCFRPERFAFISGLIGTAVMLGAIFGQAPLAWLMAQYGWRQALLFFSLVGLILAVLFLWFVRVPRLIENPLDVNTPHMPILTGEMIYSVLLNPQNWLLLFYSGFAFAPVDAFAGLWGVPFLSAACQLSQAQAALLTTCIFIGFGLGSPLIGLLADYWGRKRFLMKLSVFLSCVLLSAVIYIPHLPPWVIGLLLFGFGITTGAFMLGFVLGKALNAIAASAIVIAFINTGDLIISALTEPFIGSLLDWRSNSHGEAGIQYFGVQDYQVAFSILPLYLLCALVILYFIRDPDEKSRKFLTK